MVNHFFSSNIVSVKKVTKLPSYQVTGLPSYQFSKLSSYQVTSSFTEGLQRMGLIQRYKTFTVILQLIFLILQRNVSLNYFSLLITEINLTNLTFISTITLTP